MSNQWKLEAVRERRAQEIEVHNRAWGRFVKAAAAQRAARAKGGRVPYRIAQAVIEHSAAVERSQYRLDDLDGKERMARK